ncbi:MAG: hypothetical protein J6K82_01545 [Alphaproteobacteria bacterium]|nr:hypothetical protein [Alphaproteobacteria bacterium]
MEKNSTKYKISQVYDIAKTIINDPTFHASKHRTENLTKYTFETNDLRMDIFAPHGGEEWDIDYDDWYIKEGTISIKDETGIIYTKTKHNVGRAFDRPSVNPVALFTRLREPLFFKLIDMAEKRGLNQSEIIKNQLATLRKKTR